MEELRRERYSTWSWNYGRSPACTLLRRERFDGCGLVEAHISLDHGIIQSIQFTGDFFSAVESEGLAGRLAAPAADIGSVYPRWRELKLVSTLWALTSPGC